MTLTVETGAVVANADAYISLTDANTYFTNHGSPSDWTGATDANKEAAIRYATKWLDGYYKWYSDILDTDQVLAWPRAAFTDEDGRSVGGEDVMPTALLDATCEMALEHLKDGFVESSTGVKRERIGSAEVEYAGSHGSRNYKYVNKLVRQLGVPRSKAGKVIRA